MMAAMIVLSFVLAYPLFMLMVYFLAKIIFTPLDKIAAEQQQERVVLLMKAKRISKRERMLAHARCYWL